MTYQLRGEGRARNRENESRHKQPQQLILSVCVFLLLQRKGPTPSFWPHLCLIRYNLCVIEWGSKGRRKERGRASERAISIDIRQQSLVHFVNTRRKEDSLSLFLFFSSSRTTTTTTGPSLPALSTFGHYFWAWTFAILLFHPLSCRSLALLLFPFDIFVCLWFHLPFFSHWTVLILSISSLSFQPSVSVGLRNYCTRMTGFAH